MAEEEEFATEFLNMRIQPSLKESVAILAKADRRDLSEMAKMLIEEAITARAKKAKKQ